MIYSLYLKIDFKLYFILSRRRLFIFAVSSIIHANFAFSQSNYIVNGNLEDNSYYSLVSDSGETSKGLPYLDNYSLLFIRNFKGIFCYPYADSLPYIALRYGFGFSPIHSHCMKPEHRKNSCEIVGKFFKELDIGSEYKFQFSYFPYWGNCLLNDSISMFLLNLNGERIQELKFFIGNDKPFIHKIIAFDFLAIDRAAFFSIFISYDDIVKKTTMEEFFDSSIANRKYVITDKPFSGCNFYYPKDFDEEIKMRQANPFVYYLFREFKCTSAYDSSKYCETIIDTTLLSNIFFKVDSEVANINTIISRRLNLNGKEILVKGFSDANTDKGSNINQLSEARANNVKNLLKEQFDCNVSVMSFGSNYPVKYDPYKTLNRRVEVFEVTKKFVKCIDIKP
jgi:outer membrane protein OmpA-like peptidoglycan-associated protein